MSYCDVYIGRLDPREVSPTGGPDCTPHRRSPFFPPARGTAYGAFGHVQARLRDGRLAGWQTDWAGWVVPASRAQIAAFIDELYAGDPTYAPGSTFPWLRAQLDELRTFIATIQDDGQWALVATEL